MVYERMEQAEAWLWNTKRPWSHPHTTSSHALHLDVRPQFLFCNFFFLLRKNLRILYSELSWNILQMSWNYLTQVPPLFDAFSIIWYPNVGKNVPGLGLMTHMTLPLQPMIHAVHTVHISQLTEIFGLFPYYGYQLSESLWLFLITAPNLLNKSYL